MMRTFISHFTPSKYFYNFLIILVTHIFQSNKKPGKPLIVRAFPAFPGQSPTVPTISLFLTFILLGYIAALVIVSDDQTQSRRTVLSADDIFPASYVVTDLLCCFPVIHGNPRPLFSRHFVNSRFRQKEYTSFQATYTSSSDNPFFRLPELSLRLYEIEITPLRLQILFLQLFLPKCFAQHSPGF